MPRVHFHPEAVFRERACLLVAEQSARIRTLIPGAAIEHVGSTAIAGALTKGDVDLLVQVDFADFEAAVSALRGIYEINRRENWTATFASFKDDTSFGLPFGAQLAVAGSDGYLFVRLRDRLASDPSSLERYNVIKRSHEGGDMHAYRVAKGEFIEQLLSAAITREWPTKHRRGTKPTKRPK